MTRKAIIASALSLIPVIIFLCIALVLSPIWVTVLMIKMDLGVFVRDYVTARVTREVVKMMQGV